jgi:hypothetical protein
MKKEIIVKTIKFSSAIGAFGLMWQAVRFCQGDIGAPGVDQFAFLAQQYFYGVQLPTSDLYPFGWLANLLYYLLGISVWFVLGGVILNVGESASRIIDIGFEQYRADVKEAKRLEGMDANRDVGTLISLVHQDNGILNSKTSTIETTVGFYRVFGIVPSATKGEPVTIQKDNRLSFEFEWLCIANKRYQIKK